jgi:hypothetical protein
MKKADVYLTAAQKRAIENAKDFAEFQDSERKENDKIARSSILTAVDSIVKNNPVSHQLRAEVYALVARRQFKKARKAVNDMAGRDMFKNRKIAGVN